VSPEAFMHLNGVAECVPVSKPYKLVSREVKPESTIVDVRGARIGDGSMQMIAGPCSVESRDQIFTTAETVANSGAKFLRGGAFKPRTSPYAFQGLGEAGLEMLADARAHSGLPIVTEVMDPRQVAIVGGYADVLQVGARSMQNFPLLAEVGHAHLPVLLKRGLSSTVHELLMAAEHIMAAGNSQVILCERGIRTFETATRNTLDVSAIPVLKGETHLPVIVDPSHAGGRAALVAPLALAAIAAGADGLLVEVHPDPSAAMSDGEQSLTFAEFAALMTRVESVAHAVGRTLVRSAEQKGAA
jgi:3-deoxy-7-phosphoheptulonate synthase